MIGIGTVGAGTLRVLARNQAEIAARAGRRIEVVVVCARNLARAAALVGDAVALTDDPMHVATHPGVDVLVEVAGGTGPARDWVLAAIAAGKHVVTANKALLAVCTRHYLRVPVHSPQGMAAVGALLARQGVPVDRMEWMAGNADETRQVLVLTGKAPQGAIDLALHALQALPEVAGACVQWRVELLEG